MVTEGVTVRQGSVCPGPQVYDIAPEAHNTVEVPAQTVGETAVMETVGPGVTYTTVVAVVMQPPALLAVSV